MDGSPAPVDLAFLNEKPAGASGFVRVQGEHLLDGNGKPLRLFGTNFCGSACFPAAADAEKVAAHLAKSGVNVVRLHHMDNDWGHSLIADTATTKLDTANLAKLDKLIAELIKQGIYVNINLHVSRTYAGTPKTAPQFSKGLDYFHPPFIAAFQSYARQLLTHVNPHTGRAYAEEPGVALIEMNNENTLVLNPWWMSTLDEPFAATLQDLFVKHLCSSYKSTADLHAAWGINDGDTGPDLIRAERKAWVLESSYGAQSQVSFADGVMGWASTASGTHPWSLQLTHKGIPLNEAKAYRLTFRARSPKAAQIDVHAQNAAEPWAEVGMHEHCKLTPEWQSFSFAFSPVKVLPDGQNRIVFGLNNKVTTVEISDVHLVEVSTGYLKPGQTLEAANIPIPGRSAKAAVRRDFFAFLAQLEIDHALAMKQWLRDELGVKQLISHSQVLFGGIVGARRENLVSDIVDTHGYWHHPHFPNKSWDMADWTIENVSQISAKDGGTLTELAMQRPFGKPYSVSEYDIPAPNDHAAETFPLFVAMACTQDWSALYHFNFKHSDQYDSDRMTSFFDLPGHPGKQAFLPLAAALYRMHALPAASAIRARAISKGSVLDYMGAKAGEVWGSWRDLWWQGKPQASYAWQHRVGYQLSEDPAPHNALIEIAQGGSPVTPHPAESWVQALGDRAIVASGQLAGRRIEHAGVKITFDPTHEDSVTCTLITLDGKPFAQSKKLWLCALHRAENQSMKWDKERRSVGKDWGAGPALVLGAKAQIELPGEAPWKISALDAHGQVQAEIAAEAKRFAIDPAQRTVWWLITR
jgi:hypothetical protein